MANTDDVPSFRGDGLRNDPKPEVFMKKSLLFLINTTFDEKTKVQWFGLKMEAGAEEWFEALDAAEKLSIAAVKVAFERDYPKEAEQVLTAGEKWARVLKRVLTEAKMMEEDEEGHTGYAAWASGMQKLSIGVSDTDHSRAEEVWRALPPVIRKLTAKADTFAKLASNVRAVKRSDLQDAYEGELRLRGLEEREKSRVMTPDTPTRGATRAFANMAFGGAAAQPRLQSLFAAMPQQQQQQQAAYVPAPRAQAPVPPRPRAPGGGYTFAEHSAADIALMDRELQPRLADLTRTRMLRAANTAAYTAQVAKYDADFGNVLPTEQRPYPLTPGTVDYASNECFQCGQPSHGRGGTCAAGAPRLPFKERSMRMTASVIHGYTRPRAGVGRGGGAQPPPQGQPSPQMMFLLHILQAQQQHEAGQATEHDGAYIEEVQGNADGASN
ncbi:hypothetical protein FIBSPDRAFT_962508 [Athelia psychrophila]|uniref:CCHC-type domain-containing protein n=1 Tax=Athelia psychrophila TaxID=1759441 RepID=A0A166A2I3_9AGAM|nr:hypothetical protein FIBSPDRAFT_962508 [Fibularhizoctonia sp. CBS 109695]